MIKFEIIDDINKCKNLWDKFSPNNILWDLWDFRYCFHIKKFDFNFIVGYENKEIIGLIPLVFDKKNEIYTYFGDTFPEQNNFFLKDKNKLRLFLDQCQEDTQIYYINKSEKKFYNFDIKKDEKPISFYGGIISKKCELKKIFKLLYLLKYFAFKKRLK